MEPSSIVTLIFSGIVAISTVFYVILTWRLVSETKLLRKSQIEPHIIAYLDVAETTPSVVYIYTKNIGSGIASNVRFRIKKDINYPETGSLSDKPYFAEGIKYFPPKHEDKHLLFSFSSDLQTRSKDSICLVIEYENVLGEKKQSRYELKFRELIDKGALKPPDTYIGSIAYRLENIERLLKRLLEKHDSNHLD